MLDTQWLQEDWVCKFIFHSAHITSRVWASNPPHMFVILVLWLTMTYHCNVMSTTSHEHASTTCVNYVSSAVRSPLIQLILLCVHSYTVDLTTVMEFLLVCTQYQYDRLQSVLRAAARLVLRLPKWASVSEAMRTKLHWLPYPERVEFKLCSTIYKCLHNSAPQYLTELCIPVASLPGRCHLRSAACGDLFVPAEVDKDHWPSWIFLCWPSGLEQTTTCSKGPIFIIYNV